MRHTLLAAVVSLAAASSACSFPFRSSSTEPAAAPPPAAAPTGAPGATSPGGAPAGTAGATDAAPAAGESIAGFPDYPGATKTGYGNETKAATGIRETKVKFTTNDAFDKVKAYYQGIITKDGWQVARVQQKAGETEWDLIKGTSAVDVDVESKFGGTVEISIERKDR